MKNIKSFIVVLPLVAALLASCSKNFLDREPLSQLSPGSSFNSENQLKLYTNSFYDLLPAAGDIYNERWDNIVVNTLSSEMTGDRIVPVTDAGWSSSDARSWSALRNINFFLQNYQLGGLPDNITAPYVGVARFFRAYFYFNMVARYGDVPWYSASIASNDSALLQKPRDPRSLIIDSVVADLDYAVAHLPSAASTEQVTRWTALALKSRICLFEGTFRKYHFGDDFVKDSTGAAGLLRQSADAADTLMSYGPYKLYTSTPDKAYWELFTAETPIATEMILARTFNADLQVYHDVNYYTVSPSYGKPGLEKKLVNSYLMKDGSRFTDRMGYDTIQFYREMENRDPRLAGTIRTPGYMRINSTVKLAPDYAATATGYQLIKYVLDATHDKISGSVTPIPIFRYAEALLNFAEARAEMGVLTQADIDRSINLLKSRVGMPGLDMAAANAHPDPYLAGQYKHLDGNNKGVILEIRRERRIELVMENFRWNDLMRWKEGHLLAEQFYGTYFPGPGSFDLDGDGKTDLVIYTGDKPAGQPGVQYLKLGSDISLEHGASGGRVIINGDITKSFREDRDYLYPIPTQELQLNPDLHQNLHW
ncbi:RagB/SusD family nutrient uptake outer membrane protein [Compostibacter hankyongensis]|uniref:RagB/SusD family nutrient uptake outer membrane protein n=1 Tax=Compostibacter hankyongensis TaxID=1007089 RepID=A0ABP8FE77_9BACT